MNAGTKDECIGNLVENVTYFDPADNSFKVLNRKDIGFGYRSSFFLGRHDTVITEVKLRLQPGEKETIQRKMMANQAERRKKQPWDCPNAGSVFKRPPGRFVGQIIEQLVLKGKTIGGARVSEKHGGFIVNYNGQATGQDVVDLIRFIQETVFEKLQVKLELEQRII
jgi:UDP-N-acetylmuramate dehydrogenase